MTGTTLTSRTPLFPGSATSVTPSRTACTSPAIRQLVSKAITTDSQVIDVFTTAGLPKPEISILSENPA